MYPGSHFSFVVPVDSLDLLSLSVCLHKVGPTTKGAQAQTLCGCVVSLSAVGSALKGREKVVVSAVLEVEGIVMGRAQLEIGIGSVWQGDATGDDRAVTQASSGLGSAAAGGLDDENLTLELYVRFAVNLATTEMQPFVSAKLLSQISLPAKAVTGVTPLTRHPVWARVFTIGVPTKALADGEQLVVSLNDNVARSSVCKAALPVLDAEVDSQYNFALLGSGSAPEGPQLWFSLVLRDTVRGISAHFRENPSLVRVRALVIGFEGMVVQDARDEVVCVVSYEPNVEKFRRRAKHLLGRVRPQSSAAANQDHHHHRHQSGVEDAGGGDDDAEGLGAADAGPSAEIGGFNLPEVEGASVRAAAVNAGRARPDIFPVVLFDGKSKVSPLAGSGSPVRSGEGPFVSAPCLRGSPFLFYDSFPFTLPALALADQQAGFTLRLFARSHAAGGETARLPVMRLVGFGVIPISRVVEASGPSAAGAYTGVTFRDVPVTIAAASAASGSPERGAAGAAAGAPGAGDDTSSGGGLTTLPMSVEFQLWPAKVMETLITPEIHRAWAQPKADPDPSLPVAPLVKPKVSKKDSKRPASEKTSPVAAGFAAPAAAGSADGSPNRPASASSSLPSSAGGRDRQHVALPARASSARAAGGPGGVGSFTNATGGRRGVVRLGGPRGAVATNNNADDGDNLLSSAMKSVNSGAARHPPPTPTAGQSLSQRRPALTGALTSSSDFVPVATGALEVGRAGLEAAASREGFRVLADLALAKHDLAVKLTAEYHANAEIIGRLGGTSA